MTKEELLKTLAELTDVEPESAHGEADDALIEYINDSEITEAYNKIEKWYA